MTPVACSTCGRIQAVPAVATEPRRSWRCVRCGHRLADAGTREARRLWTQAACWAALILYPVAIGLPVLRLSSLGHRTEASVWSGSLGLLAEGEIAVGLLVFGCSVVLPLAKIVLLLLLSSRPAFWSSRSRAGLWRAVEWTGRFGMLDVLLVALLVAWLKLDDIVAVAPGPGVVAFAACVVANLLASACFDPHGMWDGVLRSEGPR